MNSQIVAKEGTSLVSPGWRSTGWTNEQVALVKRMIAEDATDDELEMFLRHAGKSGLDPLSKQIYFQKRGGKAVFITSIDGFRLVAARTNEHAGTDDTVFDNEESPNKATTTVYRIVKGMRVAFTASARWSEYCPDKGKDFMWQKMPCTMLGKCSESLALRKAFPNELGGTYTTEEMDQSNSHVEHRAQAAPQPPRVVSGPVVKPLSAVSDLEKKLVWSKLKNELKFSDEDAKHFLNSVTLKQHSSEWTKEDYERVLKRITDLTKSNPQLVLDDVPPALKADFSEFIDK